MNAREYDAREAYRLGWSASKRTLTWDLDAAQSRYERRYGTAHVSDFIAGWMDCATDSESRYAR